MSDIISFRHFAPTSERTMAQIHSPFNPAEVYNGDPIVAQVTLRNSENKTSFELPVVRISPLGIELELPSDPQSSASQIINGTPIDLTVRISNQTSEFFGLVVVSRHPERNRQLIGIRWCQETERKDPKVERRRATRWLCGEDFLPTGIAPNPTRFNDFVYFRVKDISKEGLQLSTSLRNKFLIPGMRLEAMVSFPMVGQVALHLKIKNTYIRSIEGKDYLSLGAEILDTDEKTLGTIGQYILQFGPSNSTATLKNEGLHIQSVSSALDFSFVKTADEYREVLELRKLTYGACGKIDNDLPAEKTGDIFDTRSRILTARHHGTLVGSLRLMFHDPEDTTEHEQFVKLPENFPRKDEIVEVTRVCTRPDYRGSDLFYALMKQLPIIVLQSKRRWLLGSATTSLMPIYKKIGYEGTNITYSHKDLGNEPHEILLGDIPKITAGVGVGAAIWNELYSDVSDYLVGNNDIDLDPIMNLRINIYRALAPVTRLFTSGARNPKKIKQSA